MDEKGLLSKLLDLSPNVENASLEQTLQQDMSNVSLDHQLNIDIVPETMSNQTGGGETITTNNNSGFVISMFQKYGYLYILLFVSIIISIYFIKNSFIHNFVIDKSNNDSNFEDPNATHSSRYKYIVKITFIYILVIALMLIVVYGLFVIVLSIIYESNKNIQIEAGNSFKTYLYNSYFKYKVESRRSFAGDYYISLVMILFIGFIFYIFYFFFNKKYFTNITYPVFIDKEKNDQDEWDNNMKYFILYGLMILLLMCFSLMIVNVVYKKSSGWMVCSYFTLCIFFMMLFTGKVFFNILRKDNTKIIMWTLLLISLLFANPYLLHGVIAVSTYIIEMLQRNKE